MADMDTAAKRRSIINLCSPWRATLPIPSGEIDAAARQTLLFGYSGIAWGVPVPVVVRASITTRRRASFGAHSRPANISTAKRR